MLWITAVVAVSSLALADAVHREMLNFWMLVEWFIIVGLIDWVAVSMEPWNVCHWQRIRRARRFNHVEASSNSQPVLKCGTVIHSTGVRMQVARRARRVRLEGS